MEIYLSGSTGFLGSHIKRRLKKSFKINQFLGREKLSYSHSKLDLVNKCSYFIHLSEPSLRSSYNEKLCLELINNIEVLSKNLNSKMIYFSSASVYGDKSLAPNDENSQTIPYDIYSELKLNNERIVLGNGGMVIRLSNVLGDGMHKKNIFGDIKKQIDNKTENLIIQNKCSIRDYIYIDDVCDFIETVVCANQLKNSVYNLGSGYGTSVEEIINLMSIKFDYKCNIIETKKLNSVSCNILSIEKAKQNYKWVPATTFKDIMDKIYS